MNPGGRALARVAALVVYWALAGGLAVLTRPGTARRPSDVARPARPAPSGPVGLR